MNLKVEFRVVVKLTCGWLDRGEGRNLHKRADRQTNRQTDRNWVTLYIKLIEEGKWGWTNYVISCTLAYGSYDISLVHVYHKHAHVFMSSVTLIQSHVKYLYAHKKNYIHEV